MTASVCLFTDSFHPSGVGEHMLTLATYLRERYQLSVVFPPSPNARPFLERAAALGIETLPLFVNGEASASRDLCMWLQARRIDIFHGHAGIGWEGHSGIEAAHAAGVPAIVRTDHLPYLLTKPSDCLAYRRMLSNVDRVICVSRGVYETHVAGGVPRTQLRIVRNGIRHHEGITSDQGAFTDIGVPLGSRVLLAVGRLNEQKGYQYLIDAMVTVADTRPDTHLVIVGVGPHRHRLQALAWARGLSRVVHFAGARRDVPELLAAADIFVLASEFEGLPLSVLEAMAAGLPVVGTDVCGTSEVIVDGETGRLVPPRNPAALSAALVEALTDRDRAAAWGEAGQQRVTHTFSVDRMVNGTAAVYDELLQSGTTSAMPAFAARNA